MLTTTASLALLGAGCQPPAGNGTVNVNAEQPPVAAQSATPAPAAAAPTPEIVRLPVTLPVLNAMFAEENFANDLKAKLGLTDEQITQLKQAADEAVAKLSEDGENARSTSAATKTADEKINSILGADKAKQFADYVSSRWATGGDPANADNAAKSTKSNPNGVPTDTRVVVNAPAYRMDVFKDGTLVRSYKVGIGYPEFPLPEGIRKATTVIFNPTWTPPDEPWVEGSNKVKAGQKVEAGSALNPLGPIKIPIGSPSLIHGGKSTAKLGGFASHGCVGLTNPQVQDFAYVLAAVSGNDLTSQKIDEFAKNKTQTENYKLNQPMTIELRYDTIVVEDGKLKVYRDVYEHGTNTEENLRKVLDSYGVSFDSLSETEKKQALDAVKAMAVDAGGQKVTEEEANRDRNANKNQSKTVTRNIKGKKEMVVEIAALKGKGYPAPVDLNAGTRSNKPLDLNAVMNKTAGNTPANSNTNTVAGANTSANGKAGR